MEIHPRLQQRELRAFCERHHIHVQGYSPLGVGRLVEEATVTSLAAEHGRTPAQILLRWALQVSGGGGPGRGGA